VPQAYGSRLCTWRLDEFRADTKYVSGAKQLRHTGWAKNGATDSWPQFCQFLTDLWKFFIGRFLGKFAVKQLSEIPPHLAYVATLPCETLMSAKQAINDKLQGIVATYLSCCEVVNNQIKKGLFLSLWMKTVLKSVNIWHSYKQERDCFVQFLRLLAVCWPSAQSADIHARFFKQKYIGW